MLVAVGSQNPVKIESVRLAFVAIWPTEDWVVRGCSVASSVADQPMTDDEARQGARARAVNAIATLNADYGVGLEGGLNGSTTCGSTPAGSTSSTRTAGWGSARRSR